MLKLNAFLISLFFCLLGFSQQKVSIIPQPVSLVVNNGIFTITKNTVIAVRDDGDRKAAELFNEYLQQVYGLKLDIDKQEGKNYIRLNTKKFIKAPDKDAYSLNVTKEGVSIEGDTYAGTFYGIQSLIQLLPVNVSKTANLSIPLVVIQDAPRFAYRGMHLDVGRHMFPLSFIKKYIDYIALHKMNYFHWHLTEDQGWRIEIKKYPKLTAVGGWRNGTIIGRYPGTGNDNIRYGGFYTQDEVKKVVQYATDRQITVVPEIEMPGHASAALTAYPHLGCPGTGPYKVEETWGVFDDIFCAGNDSTFLFLQDVLDEVIPLFPSKYVHVGGDEAPKNNWKKCPRCQARIQQEGLKDEHGLQSYFIQRMEKYINSKGKTLIGWDEILEGGLAPNAVVMSWRGEEGGIAAAKENHYVIMTPGGYVYFDHAQSQSEDSVTIGGYTPIEKVYGYEPIPKELNAQQAKYILGAQANVWTEYIHYPSKVEYQIFPRMSALSEVLWSPKEKKNWSDFEKRLQTQFQRYRMWGANFSTAYYDIDAEVLPAPSNKGVQVKLTSNDKAGKLTYGVAGSHYPKNYTGPVSVTNSSLITVLYSKDGHVLDSITLDLKINKATGKKITLTNAPLKDYQGQGAFTLVNGIINEKGLARNRELLGFRGNNLEAVIDLGTAQKISNVVVHAVTSGGSRVNVPESAEVYGSTDGKTFKQLSTTNSFTATTTGKGNFVLDLTPTTTRYLKVIVKPVMKIAEGRPGAGENALMFVDEIEVN